MVLANFMGIWFAKLLNDAGQLVCWWGEPLESQRCIKMERLSFFNRREPFTKGWNRKGNIDIVLLSYYDLVCAKFVTGTAKV